jgi:hypothetical protein
VVISSSDDEGGTTFGGAVSRVAGALSSRLLDAAPSAFVGVAPSVFAGPVSSFFVGAAPSASVGAASSVFAGLRFRALKHATILERWAIARQAATSFIVAASATPTLTITKRNHAAMRPTCIRLRAPISKTEVRPNSEQIGSLVLGQSRSKCNKAPVEYPQIPAHPLAESK